MSKRGIYSTVVAALIAGVICWTFVIASPLGAASGKIFAQKLVDEILPRHSELTGLEIAAFTNAGCKTIAATNPKDLGEKCDKDELRPMETGQPFVERESDGFDVTFPLHDATGKVIGAAGMDFKIAAGQTNDSVVKQGKQIVAEMESQIPSKDKLFEPQN